MNQDPRIILAGAIVFAIVVLAWMFRFETLPAAMHYNRITGATCDLHEECWFP